MTEAYRDGAEKGPEVIDVSKLPLRLQVARFIRQVPAMLSDNMKDELVRIDQAYAEKHPYAAHNPKVTN